jgi:hypothetical protein
MDRPVTPPPDTHQARFERRWGHLRRAPVRALAWLLDAPDLLDVDDPHWAGRVATIAPLTPADADWLAALDADPAPLAAMLGEKTYTRLGLYAEKLMALYFAHQGRLVAHGVQVRAARNDTVGEFDFLLDAGPGGLEHIEFATKFYLLSEDAGRVGFDTFVGPNLADSLGRKMRKVFEHQLVLGAHPAAQALLPRPVVVARALVKGWLFYPHGTYRAIEGITAGHCRGFWCAVDEIEALAGEQFVIVPRLAWLAPYRAAADAETLDRAGLALALADHFTQSASPLLVAAVHQVDDGIVETERGFIVPSDWRTRAAG